MADPIANLKFDSRAMPDPHEAYVAWVDVMGTRTSLARSLHIAANFVFKLHIAALDSLKPASKPAEEVHLYPVMDGMYAAVKDRAALRAFLRSMFVRLAAAFCSESNNEYRFIPKASIAFGEIIHGGHIGPSGSATLEAHPMHKRAILLGAPMVDAAASERDAPPFGVQVHVSARKFLTPKERRASHMWWPWFKSEKVVASQLTKQLQDYFRWCGERSGPLAYAAQRIAEHQRQAVTYFHAVEAQLAAAADRATRGN